MNYILILLVSFVFPQNFIYNSDDWFTISNPGYITSIATTKDEVIISAKNGVYSYNKYTQEFLFIEDFVRKFNSNNYHMIHYDNYRDYLWILTDENLSFKPVSSNFWREIDFYELNLNNHYNILNIGCSTEYLFLNVGSEFIVLNPYTGSIVTDEVDGYSDIEWTGSSRNILSHNFDLSRFHSYEGYNFISNSQIEYDGRFLDITAITLDDNYLWVGTNSGEIFLCDLSLRNAEKIKSMPLFSDLKISYLDERMEWWFATNDLITMYDDFILRKDQIFMLRWIEDDNKWISYNQKKYQHIRSSDITCFYRSDKNLYVGTYHGLLIFNINRKKWMLLSSVSDNLKSDHILDLEFYNNQLFIATKSGIDVISVSDNIMIKNDILSQLDGLIIQEIKIKDDNMFILSDTGLFKYNIILKEMYSLINDNFKNMIIVDKNNFLLTKRNKVLNYNIDKNEKNTLVQIKNIKDIAKYENYIWINLNRKVILYDMTKNVSFEYDSKDGITGDMINQVDCDENWVWFTTDKGMSFFNWNKYHE